MLSAEELKSKGNESFSAKNYQQAIEYYTKAIELDSTKPAYYSNRAGCYASLQDWEKSLQDGEAAINIDPNFIKGYSRVGLAKFKLGQQEEAVAIIEKGLAIDPNNEQLKKDLTAVSAKPNLGFNPNDLSNLMNNPQIQKLMKENPQLINQFLQNPEMLKNPQMMQAMANMFSQSAPPTQNHEPTNFKAEKTPEPQKTEISEFKKIKDEAGVLYKKKNFEEAVALYDKCSEINPEELIVRSNKAACLIELKKFEEAIKCAEDGIEIYNGFSFDKRNPAELAKLQGRKGRALFLTGDLKGSLDAYAIALLEDRTPVLEEQQREVQKAQKKAEELAYIDSSLSDEARERGNKAYQAGDFGKAISEYEEAQRRNPSDEKVYNNLAMCFIKTMRFNEALKQVEKALEINPKFIKALLRKAAIFNATKEYHKAIKVYREIQEIEPSNKDASDGIRATEYKIATSMKDMSDEDRLKRAMNDPEIASIMADPMVRIALEQMQTNPKNVMEYMNDKTLGPKIQKLIQAGVIKMG